MAKVFATDVQLPRDPTSAMHAATKQYVDTGLAAKANSSHTHAGADITSGQLSSSRMPAELSDTRSVSGATGTVATDASLLGNFRDLTCTGNITLSVPTGMDTTKHQVLHYSCLASGATRTVTLNASIQNASGVTFPLSVPTGKVGRISMEYMPLLSAWVVTAAAVTP